MEYGSRIKCGMTIMLVLLFYFETVSLFMVSRRSAFSGSDAVLRYPLMQCFVSPSRSTSSEGHAVLREDAIRRVVAGCSRQNSVSVVLNSFLSFSFTTLPYFSSFFKSIILGLPMMAMA